MSQPVLIKIYGSLFPASEPLATAFKKVCAQGLPADTHVATLDGQLLRISFEGIYMPLDELDQLWRSLAGSEASGKLDILDLEAWRLMRYTLADGQVNVSSAPLNNVLDYSGH